MHCKKAINPILLRYALGRSAAPVFAKLLTALLRYC